MSCSPRWSLNATSCPYGALLLGDVTLPHHATPVEYAAVLYSFVPAVIAVLAFLELARSRGKRAFYTLSFILLCVVVNEVILKSLISQPRPGYSGLMRDSSGGLIGSCCRTCGMPSTHATVATGLLALFLWDGLYRVVPDPCIDVQNSRNQWRVFECMPFIPQSILSYGQYTFLSFFWLALLAPVPLSRVVLHDHDVVQVIVGCFVGVVCACCFRHLAVTCLQPAFSRTAWRPDDLLPPAFKITLDGVPVAGAVITRDVVVSPAEQEMLRRPLSIPEPRLPIFPQMSEHRSSILEG